MQVRRLCFDFSNKSLEGDSADHSAQLQCIMSLNSFFSPTHTQHHTIVKLTREDAENQPARKPTQKGGAQKSVTRGAKGGGAQRLLSPADVGGKRSPTQEEDKSSASVDFWKGSVWKGEDNGEGGAQSAQRVGAMNGGSARTELFQEPAGWQGGVGAKELPQDSSEEGEGEGESRPSTEAGSEPEASLGNRQQTERAEEAVEVASLGGSVEAPEDEDAGCVGYCCL